MTEQVIASIPLEDIFFPAATRLRSAYGDLEKLAQSLIRRGQLQPVVLRPFIREEYPDAPEGKRWTLVDGGRRIFATALVYKLEKEIPNVLKGCVLSMPRDVEDPTFALELEYHANSDRKQFIWQERIEYIRRVHEHYVAMDDNWSVKHTAELLELGERMVYAYLQMTTDPVILMHEDVQACTSFRTAWKKFTIIKDQTKRRSKIVVPPPASSPAAKKAGGKAEEAESGDNSESSPLVTGARPEARKLITNADCREWIKEFPDEKFTWVHWDPPYGHRQAERASIHGSIVDDQDYARELMSDMFPELWRVLVDGHWMVLWYHPSEYQWIVDTLSGHVCTPDGSSCKLCGKEWIGRPSYCSVARTPWWVNPYPNVWVKGRPSDGHEIKRFLINDHEEFLLAAKVDACSDPILPNTDRSNVFSFSGVGKSDRRHVTHKPSTLLREVLSVISYPGELGCDPSVGSGSIIEAALSIGRIAVGCELDESYWLGAVDAVQRIFDGESPAI